MTHDGEEGKPAEKTAGSAGTALGKLKSMEKDPAGGLESKKREKSEEKEKKDEPARANLAKSGGGSLATSPSRGGNGCKAPITTTTTSSMPTNPFKPILPPKLSKFSIELSVGDDFGAVLEENADSAGATGPTSVPFSPSLRAPSNKPHRTIAKPPTGVAAPSTVDATSTERSGDSALKAALEGEKSPAGAMRQQVCHPPIAYAAPTLHAPAKSDGVESRVSEDPSPIAEPGNAPLSPSLRAPTDDLYRTDSTPSTGASAPSTSDMVLAGKSPLSPTLAARRQTPASFLESESTSGIWSHIPTPLAHRPTQYCPMPLIDFEPSSEADGSWADQTKEEFPVAKAKEEVGEKKEEWRKVIWVKKGKEVRTTKTAAPAQSQQGSEENLLRLRKNLNLVTTDLLLIQEPPRPLKPFNDPNWRLVTPPPTSLPDGEPAPTRNLILITTCLGPAVATQVAVESGDVMAIYVELRHGKTIRVINMYIIPATSEERR
ncbi:hypothetical protein JCM10049v2_006932 [Rhodotorula toruloides]